MISQTHDCGQGKLSYAIRIAGEPKELGSDSQQGILFFAKVWGPLSLLLNVDRLGCEVGYLSASIAEVKHAFTPTYTFLIWCLIN
jgi:hypothetical protein